MTEDLDYFCDMLEEHHTNLYAFVSQEDFTAAKQQIAEKIPSMTESEFYCALRHLLSLVGDAHTNVAYTDSPYRHVRILGFGISQFNDDWRLMRLEGRNEDYLGYCLTAINDVPIDEVLAKVKTIVSSDNDVWARQQSSEIINVLETLQYLGIADKDTESVTLQVKKDIDGPAQDFVVHAMNEEQFRSAKIVSAPAKETPTAPNDPYYSARTLDQTTFLIQYNTCAESPDMPMSDFIKQVSHDIQDGSYSKVVLDMRYNSGGNSTVFEPMIVRLIDLKRAEGFEVYVLIGRNTFSAAVTNTVQSQRHLDATLVGTPTGGSVNFYSEVKAFTLRHLPIEVYYSTQYSEMMPGYDKDSLYPDIAVDYTYEDYVNGIDPEIETVLRQ